MRMETRKLYWEHEGQRRFVKLTLGEEVIINEIGDAPSRTRKEPSKPSKLNRFWSYVRAEASLKRWGPVPDQVEGFRATCCTGKLPDGTVVAPPCPQFKFDPDNDRDGWCQACSCPDWKRSRMSIKWTMPHALCPARRFAKAMGVRMALRIRRKNGIR